MTYKLPEPVVLSTPCGKETRLFSSDQMQQAYQAGRDAMRDECAAFVVRNAGVVPVSCWERMIKELK